MNKKEDIDWAKKEIRDSKSLFMLEAIKANKRLHDLSREGHVLEYNCKVSTRGVGIVIVWCLMHIILMIIFLLLGMDKAIMIQNGMIAGWLMCQLTEYYNKSYCRDKLFKQWRNEK